MFAPCKFRKKPPRLGFSLLELLVVVALLGVLSVLAVPALSGLTRSNTMNKNLLILSGVFEQARQYAISRNTYVWVVLTSASNTGLTNSLKVGQIASLDGTDVLSWSPASTLVSGSSNLEMVGRPQELRMVRIENSAAADAGASMASVNITGGTLTFTRAVQFTPTGEARVGASVSRFIDLAVLEDSAVGSSNRAVLRLTGLTGKTSVQRN